MRAQVPTYAHPVIRRQRLLDALNATLFPPDIATNTVALLCAPVGSGKTMLLADWATELTTDDGGPTIGWLSVEECDNDLIAFRTAIRGALANTGSPRIAGALRELPSCDSQNFPVVLAEVLGALGEPIWMILDDCHLLHHPAVLEELAGFLRWAPPSLRTVLSGRFEPPLAMHRLRVEGRIRDFSPRELGFTEEESTALLAEHGVRLDAADLRTIHQRTEGWAAGLRLAAITLARHEDPAAVIADFGGGNRVVADYLINEVLAHLGADERTFVVETGVPEVFTADLAEALTGNPDAHTLIETLEHENFLVERVPGSPGCFRYHPLLREYLRAEVSRLGRRAVSDLNLVASAWFAAAHDSVSALEHALRAADAKALMSLLERDGLRLVLTGRWSVIVDILDRAPQSVRDEPSIRLVRAAAELARGNDAAATSNLGAVHQINADRHANQAVFEDSLRLQVSIQSGGIEGALKVQQAGPVGATGNPEIDALALLQAGMGELYLGRLEPARRHLEVALSNAQTTNLPSVIMQALAALSAVAAYQNRFNEMGVFADQAEIFGREHGLTDHRYFHLARLFGAMGHYLRVDDASMNRLTMDAVPALVKCGDPAIACVATCFGAVFAFDTSNDRLGLAKVLRTYAGVNDRRPLPPGATAILAPSVQRAYLHVGQVGWAGQVADLAAGHIGNHGDVAVLRATMALHHRRSDVARRELAPVLSGVVDTIASTTLIRAWLMEATMAQTRKETTTARSALGEALTLAEPHQILRPFRDGGEPVRELLNHHHGRLGSLNGFAERARSLLPCGSTSAAGLLTARESELLLELPSWRTAEQIAADLYVSVNTVKTHLRGIYRKLDVRTRRDAITEARARGLL